MNIFKSVRNKEIITSQEIDFQNKELGNYIIEKHSKYKLKFGE